MVIDGQKEHDAGFVSAAGLGSTPLRATSDVRLDQRDGFWSEGRPGNARVGSGNASCCLGNSARYVSNDDYRRSHFVNNHGDAYHSNNCGCSITRSHFSHRSFAVQRCSARPPRRVRGAQALLIHHRIPLHFFCPLVPVPS